jgi:tRNA nucleotidyltransferase (CCA-adding enzyme)
MPVFCNDLDKDFILNFWKDLLLNSSCPSAGMEALKETGILKENYIELNNLIGVNQNPDWHQEGDVWIHTKMVVDAGARISRSYNLQEEDSFVLMLACICHDLGKPIAKKGIDGKKHDKEGEVPTKTFLKQIGVSEDIIEKVVPLVVEHMFTHNDDFSEKDGRSLAERMHPGRVRDLVYLAEADCQGMVNNQEDNKARKKLLDMAEKNGFD